HLRHAASASPASHSSRSAASKITGLPGSGSPPSMLTRGTTIEASPRFLNAPISATMSCTSIRGWSASVTITASSRGDSACSPMRTDDAWPSSGFGLRTIEIGKWLTAASIESAWWPSTSTTSSTPAPDSATSWRITSGTPPSSSSAFGRPPRRDPAPAASSTAPTVVRLYRPLAFSRQPIVVLLGSMQRVDQLRQHRADAREVAARRQQIEMRQRRLHALAQRRIGGLVGQRIEPDDAAGASLELGQRLRQQLRVAGVVAIAHHDDGGARMHQARRVLAV